MIYKIVGAVLLMLSAIFLILTLSCIKDAAKATRSSSGINRIGLFLLSFLADSWELIGLMLVTALAGLLFLLK